MRRRDIDGVRLADGLARAGIPVASKVFDVELDEAMLEAVEAELGFDELFPREDDTEETLLARIAKSSLLDKMLVREGGYGKRRVLLIGTRYPQPRRISWSVVVVDTHKDADGDEVRTMYNYTFSGTEPHNWHCRPMPMPIMTLGAHLFWVAWFALSKGCQRAGPPTACQALYYYGAFAGEMGLHKDNFSKKDFLDWLFDFTNCRGPDLHGMGAPPRTR